jgi:PAS domain S-box-containing protein
MSDTPTAFSPADPALLLLDAQDRIVWWNVAFTDLMVDEERAILVLGAPFAEQLQRWHDVQRLRLGGAPDHEVVAQRMARHKHYSGPFLENWGGGWIATSEQRLPDGSTLITHTPIDAPNGVEALSGDIREDDLLIDLLESIPAATFVLDRAYRLVTWNRLFSHLLPAEMGESLKAGQHMGQVVAELGRYGDGDATLPDHDEWQGLIAHYRAGGEPREITVPGGHVVIPIVRRVGNGGVLVLLNDITQLRRARRKAAEARLQRREMETQQRAVFENSPIALCICEPRDGLVLMANNAFARLLDSEADLVRGLPLRDVWSDEAIERVLLAMNLGEDLSGLEVPIHYSDGMMWTSVSMTPTRYQGQDCYLLWFADITQSKRAAEILRTRERHLMAVIEAAQDGVFDIVLDNGTANFSPRFWTMLGHSDREVLMQGWQMTHVDFLLTQIHSEDVPAFLRLTQRAAELVDEHDNGFQWMCRLRRPDDAWAWVYLRGKAVRDGPYIRLLGTSTDLTVQKQAEDHLRQAKEQAEAASRSKSAFLATMSHEIRTPMHNVLGLMELLGESALSAQQAEMVRLARDSATGLLAILDDILDISKIEAGKLKLEVLPADPRSLIESIAESMRLSIERRGLVFTLEISAGLPASVLCDPTRIRQILLNLLSNAQKFTARGGITLSVQQVTASAETWVPADAVPIRIEIRDTGIGVPEEARERLFKPFNQADDSTSRRYGGTGLGLSICLRLVEIMGGRIGVDSLVGRGSTFWVELPLRPVEATLLDAGGKHRLAGYRFLVAAPGAQQPLADGLAGWLRRHGGVVDVALDRMRTEQRLRADPYDVVALHDGLSGADPLELARSLRSKVPEANLLLFGPRAVDGGDLAVQPVPVADDSDAVIELLAQAVLEAISARERQAQVARRGRPVLVAEDTPTAQKVIEMQLCRLGVACEIVPNGVAALEALGRGDYAMLLTDLHMPEMDGQALARNWRLRERERRLLPLPIVMLTADVMARDQRESLEGVDDFITKPVTHERLWAMLRRFGMVVEEQPVFVAEPTAAALPAIDTAALSAQFGVLDDAVVDMLGYFAETTEAGLAEFIALLTHARADMVQRVSLLDKARKQAHGLKGAARSAGALCLGDLLQGLEGTIRAGTVPSEGELSALQAEYGRACAEIAAMRAAPAVA